MPLEPTLILPPLLVGLPLPIGLRLFIMALTYFAISRRSAQSIRCFETVLNHPLTIDYMGVMGRVYALLGPWSIVAFLLLPLLLTLLWQHPLPFLLARVARLLFMPHLGLVIMFKSDAARRKMPVGVLRRMDAYGPILLRGKDRPRGC